MTLYHGSKQVVKFPEIRMARYNKDFYFGFYCTLYKEQAKRWATRYTGSGMINEYVYTPNEALKVLKFPHMTEEWLDFIVACRSGKAHDYDIVEGPMALVIEAVNRMAAQKISKGYKVGIIGTEETVGRYRQGIIKSVGTREDEATIANHLYGILREFDADEVDYIYSESFATGGMGNAIMNRLLKAAGHHVIHV